MSTYTKGADPQAMKNSGDKLGNYRTDLATVEHVAGRAMATIQANGGGNNIQRLIDRYNRECRSSLRTVEKTLGEMSKKVITNATEQAVASGTTLTGTGFPTGGGGGGGGGDDGSGPQSPPSTHGTWNWDGHGWETSTEGLSASAESKKPLPFTEHKVKGPLSDNSGTGDKDDTGEVKSKTSKLGPVRQTEVTVTTETINPKTGTLHTREESVTNTYVNGKEPIKKVGPWETGEHSLKKSAEKNWDTTDPRLDDEPKSKLDQAKKDHDVEIKATLAKASAEQHYGWYDEGKTGDENLGASASGGAGLELKGDVSASIGKDGLTAGAHGEARVGLYGEAEAHGKIGVVEGSVSGNAMVGAEATGDASVSIGKDGVKAGAGVEAFAGAKAGADVSVSVAGAPPLVARSTPVSASMPRLRVK